MAIKNETLVRAITGIDEDLISEAHIAQKSPVIPWKGLGALAACLALIVSAVFLLQPDGGTVLRMSGQELTAQAVAIVQPGENAGIRSYSIEPSACFTVSLEADVQGRAVISVLNGTMQVFDRRDGSLLYEGGSFSAERDVSILWTVEAGGEKIPGEVQRFEMSVKSAKTTDTVILARGDDGVWTIRKTTD